MKTVKYCDYVGQQIIVITTLKKLIAILTRPFATVIATDFGRNCLIVSRLTYCINVFRDDSPEHLGCAHN